MNSNILCVKSIEALYTHTHTWLLNKTNRIDWHFDLRSFLGKLVLQNLKIIRISHISADVLLEFKHQKIMLLPLKLKTFEYKTVYMSFSKILYTQTLLV